MKNLIILLITVFSFQYTKAQEFEETQKYIVANRMDTKQQEYATSLFDIVASKDHSKKITTLSIIDLDFFEEVIVSVLPNPNLENIEEVIKVDINYTTCCAQTETYFFMLTNTNDVIELPYLENLYCDNELPQKAYIFPSQVNGKAGSILKTEITFTKKYRVKDVQILQSFVWNDNDFNNNEEMVMVSNF